MWHLQCGVAPAAHLVRQELRCKKTVDFTKETWGFYQKWEFYRFTPRKEGIWLAKIGDSLAKMLRELGQFVDWCEPKMARSSPVRSVRSEKWELKPQSCATQTRIFSPHKLGVDEETLSWQLDCAKTTSQNDIKWSPMTCHLKNQNTFATINAPLISHSTYRTVGPTVLAYLWRAVVKLQRQKQLQARLPEPARINSLDIWTGSKPLAGWYPKTICEWRFISQKIW